MKKLLVSILVIVGLSTIFTPLIQATQAIEVQRASVEIVPTLWQGQAGTVTGSNVHVRTGPGTNFSTNGTVPFGTTVLHLGNFQSVNGVWWENVRITSGTLNGISGWMSGEFLGNWHTPGQGMNYNTMTRQQLAQEILARHNGNSTTGRRITLLTVLQDLNNTNRRSAFANIEDTASNQGAMTHWGRVNLSPDLLRAILRMNDRYGNIQINTIAGGMHTGGSNDPHARGLAVDFQRNLGLSNVTPGAILDYLEHTWGFRTQRNHRGSSYNGTATMFHLEIWNGH